MLMPSCRSENRGFSVFLEILDVDLFLSLKTPFQDFSVVLQICSTSANFQAFLDIDLSEDLLVSPSL